MSISSIVIRCPVCGHFMDAHPDFFQCTRDDCRKKVKVEITDVKEMANLTMTEVDKVVSLVESNEYQLSREMEIARRKIKTLFKGFYELNKLEVLDDLVIALALECLINRI
jgi:predicted  nucleic acid-binding Zn-ribbon protein